MKIRLVCLVRKSAQLLPHMIEHYRSIGVSAFDIYVHALPPFNPFLSDVQEVVARYGLKIASVVSEGNWSDIRNQVIRQTMFNNPDDWFIIAEQDELQVYEDPIGEVVNRCETYGYDNIVGCYVDRLGPGGSIPMVDDHTPLWDQFPLGATVTNPITFASPIKIALAKGRVRLQADVHGWTASSRAACPIDRCLVPIHRFCWTFNVLEQLHDVTLHPQTEYEWQVNEEIERFIHHVELNGGRVGIDDPSCLTAKSSPTYPEWHRLKEQCAHHEISRAWPERISALLHGRTAIRLNVGGLALEKFRGHSRWETVVTYDSVDMSSCVEAGDALLYVSCRCGEFGYLMADFEPGRQYDVKLHFAELQWLSAGRRCFNIMVNNILFRQNLDVFREAGGSHRALVLSTKAVADVNGNISLDFLAGTNDRPMLSGIEIVVNNKY